jgi:hypothetical protein
MLSVACVAAKIIIFTATVVASTNVATSKTLPRKVWLKRRLDEIRSKLKEIVTSYSERKERTGKGELPKRIIRLPFPSKIAQG